MLRQTTFGIALSMLVLATGLMTSPIPSNSTQKKAAQNQPSSNPSKVSAASNSSTHSTKLEKLVFEQINQYRVSQGLSKLTLNTSISQQARIHSHNMAQGKIPFSHQGFEGRVKAIPLNYNSAAENVAFNLGYSNPASQAVIGWLHSPGHRKNIRGKYNLTGIGVAVNQRGEVYLTQIFLHTR